MKEIKSVTIVGAGAIGAAYGSMFYNADPQSIRILADEKRVERYRNSGFTVNNRSYPFNCVTTGEGCIDELIIIAVKHHALEEALELIKNRVGKETVILSLLNGISSEKIIGERFGMDRVLYSICVGIDAVREGNCVNFSSPGRILFGEETNHVRSEKVEAVKRFFDTSSIPYEIPENMLKTLWWKFMVNVCINQTSAVLKAPYGVFQSAGDARELMNSTAGEVIALSKEVGINLDEKDLEDWHKILDKLAPNNKTSMLQDIEARRKTEVDIFGEVVCAIAKQYNMETPINNVLVKIIKTVELMNKNSTSLS